MFLGSDPLFPPLGDKVTITSNTANIELQAGAGSQLQIVSNMGTISVQNIKDQSKLETNTGNIIAGKVIDSTLVTNTGNIQVAEVINSQLSSKHGNVVRTHNQVSSQIINQVLSSQDAVARPEDEVEENFNSMPASSSSSPVVAASSSSSTLNGERSLTKLAEEVFQHLAQQLRQSNLPNGEKRVFSNLLGILERYKKVKSSEE